MPTARRTCSTPGCGNPSRGGRCDTCTAKATKLTNTTKTQYTTKDHRFRFRYHVLRNDPICTCPGCPRCERQDHSDRHCSRPSTRADHFPLSRKQLIARRLDPNDPQHGRGLCANCDSHQTTQRQPGGWNADR